MKAVEEDKGMIFGSKEEWEKGRHSPRPDETIEYCGECGKKGSVKMLFVADVVAYAVITGAMFL